jgi:hypothetical protein
MTKEAAIKFIRGLGLFSIAAGGFGLVACVPYVALNNWIIVGAAGIVSVACAVVYASGLITVAH